MSSEQNKAVIRRFFEALNDGYNMDEMAALMADIEDADLQDFQDPTTIVV